MEFKQTNDQPNCHYSFVKEKNVLTKINDDQSVGLKVASSFPLQITSGPICC